MSESDIVSESQLNQFVDSAAENTRSLEFLTNDLGQEIDLLLMFEPPKVGKLYVDLFPIYWKVLSFSATGVSSVSVEYTADTGFFAPMSKAGNHISASNSQRCRTGQRCTLKTNANGNSNYITPAIAGTAKVLQCLNGTERPASIGIGYFNEAGNKMEPTFVWNNIAKGSTLSAELTPKLKIYAVSNYKETRLIRGDIELPLLFEKNLIALRNFTEWNVSIDAGSGQVVIEEA